MIEVTGKYNTAKIFTDTVDQESIAQVIQLCNQPCCAGSRIRMMPDIHAGAGCTIGTTMTIKDKICPNLVGVDIGCGMETICIKEKHIEPQKLDRVIRSGIPSGFEIRKKAHRFASNIDLDELYCAKKVDIDRAYLSIGTLGGGNHFIEANKDKQGNIYLVIHSGSRHFGKSVCDYFHERARELNKKWHSAIPDEYRLAFLPVDSRDGKAYINWMKLCLDFAYENREKMMLKTKAIFEKYVKKFTDIKEIEYSMEVNCHHNYAALEHHYDKDVWVHRKGAIKAEDGDIAVIPGAMGSYSYIVKGKGNKESFCSSSHGAGRAYSRKGAMNAFTCEKVMCDLKKQKVVLGKRNKKDVAEECRFAYKDIDMVMENQTDNVEAIKKLRTVGVVKG